MHRSAAAVICSAYAYSATGGAGAGVASGRGSDICSGSGRGRDCATAPMAVRTTRFRDLVSLKCINDCDQWEREVCTRRGTQ